MVDFELIKTPEELNIIITHLLSEIEVLKSEESVDHEVVDIKVNDCLKLLNEMEDVDESGKWKDVIMEHHKYLSEHKFRCNICKINEVEMRDSTCAFCTKSLEFMNKNQLTRDLYLLALRDPQKFFDKCGYTCYACGKVIEKDKLKFCKNCKIVCYCDRACQKNHWHRKNGHKRECRKMGIDFEKQCDKEQLLTARAMSQASLLSVFQYAIEKLEANGIKISNDE